MVNRELRKSFDILDMKKYYSSAQSIPFGKNHTISVRRYSLTHVDERGKASMVDVGSKLKTKRTAVARALVTVGPVISKLISENNLKKGDVLSVAQLAGIMAAKRTSDLIPLCHPLMLSFIKVDLKLDTVSHQVEIIAEVNCTGETGVEMEALTAVTISALTVYDMCKKASSPDTMEIHGIRLISKTGGQKDFSRIKSNCNK